VTSLMLHLLCQTRLCALHNIVPQTFQRVQTMIIRKVERTTIVAKAKKTCLFFYDLLKVLIIHKHCHDDDNDNEVFVIGRSFY